MWFAHISFMPIAYLFILTETFTKQKVLLLMRFTSFFSLLDHFGFNFAYL